MLFQTDLCLKWIGTKFPLAGVHKRDTVDFQPKQNHPLFKGAYFDKIQDLIRGVPTYMVMVMEPVTPVELGFTYKIGMKIMGQLPKPT